MFGMRLVRIVFILVVVGIQFANSVNTSDERIKDGNEHLPTENDQINGGETNGKSLYTDEQIAALIKEVKDLKNRNTVLEIRIFRLEVEMRVEKDEREKNFETVSKDLVKRTAPVDGGYSKWGGYSACTVTCGHGKQVRTRSCDSPATQHHGKSCAVIGPTFELRDCGEPCRGSAFTMTFTENTLNLPTIQKTAESFSSFTLTTWAKYENLDGDRSLFIIHPDSMECNFAAPGLHNGLFDTYFGTRYNLITNFKPMLNTWNHISLTHQGTTYQVFINGSLSISKVMNINQVIHGNVHLAIGNDADPVGPGGKCIYNDVNEGFIGSITHMFLWNRVLNHEEIKAAYKMNPVLDGMFISWNEMRNAAVNKDVVITDFPF